MFEGPLEINDDSFQMVKNRALGSETFGLWSQKAKKGKDFNLVILDGSAISHYSDPIIHIHPLLTWFMQNFSGIKIRTLTLFRDLRKFI